MASQRLFLVSFVSVWFKGQTGKHIFSSFSKRGMKKNKQTNPQLAVLPPLPGLPEFSLVLAPFVLFTEQNKISSQVAEVAYELRLLSF